MLKRIELIFKAIVLKMAGLFLRKGRANCNTIDLSRIRRILIIRPEKIGDLFITLPVIDRLKRSVPHLEVSLLVSNDCLSLIENDPRISNIYLYRKSLRKDLETLFAMQDEKFDVVIDMVGRDSAAFLIMKQLISRNAFSIAVGKNKFKKYYDFNYDLRNGNRGHVITNSMKLLETFDVSYELKDAYVPPYLSEHDKYLSSEFLQKSENSERLIGYNLSAGSPNRIWPDDNAYALLKKILEDDASAEFILISVSSDRERAEALRRKLGANARLTPQGASLKEISAILRSLDSLITPDTSLVHIARSFHVPVIGFYLKNLDNYKIWGPLGQERGRLLSASGDNVADITVDDVYDEYLALVPNRNRKLG